MIPHSTGGAMKRLLTAIYPDCRIVDTSFPNLLFASLHNDVVAAFHPGRSWNEDEKAFYTRFRQRGGHLPLLSWADLKSYVRADRTASGKRPKSFVVAVRDCDVAEMRDDLTEILEVAAVLVYSRGDVSAVQYTTRPTEVFTIDVVSSPQSEVDRFVILDRRTCGADELNAFLSVAKDLAPETYVPETYVHESSGASGRRTIRLELPASQQRMENVAIRPDRLIHDGARKSEISGDYSWLWIGKERHVRMLLGAIPERFRSVRVIVPKAFGTANLRAAKIFLNGKRVESGVEIWDEGVGAVSAALPGFPSELVLGFAVPFATLLEDGITELSACIDKVELRL